MSRYVLLIVALAVAMTIVPAADAFVSPRALVSQHSATAAFALGKKSKDQDLSSIESRDMTRQEMLDLNAKNEEIMNMELSAMTAFSLVISLPIFYLCWVAFFSD
jgi:hypothetical protein